MDVQGLGKVIVREFASEAEYRDSVELEVVIQKVAAYQRQIVVLKGRCNRLAEYVRGERRFGELLLSDLEGIVSWGEPVCHGDVPERIDGAPEGGE